VPHIGYLFCLSPCFTDHKGFPMGLKTEFPVPKEEGQEEEEEEGLPKAKL